MWFFLSLLLLTIGWGIIIFLGVYLWRTKQYLWEAYDKLEEAVKKMNPVLDELEREQFEQLFKDIERHLREG